MAVRGSQGFRPARASPSSHKASMGMGRISSQDQPHAAVRNSSHSGLILQSASEANCLYLWDQF